MMETIYRVRELAYATPTGRLLQDRLSFDVKSGQMLLITGSNGCGKSTLLKTLLGQFEILTGTIECQVNERAIEYIPQLENTEIHFPLTLRDVLSVSQNRRVKWQDISTFGLLREEQLDSAWNTASGGERKRALLSRALLRKPRLLVFDEPMNHLDSESRRSMIKMMARFLADKGNENRGIVMVCHQGLHDEEWNLFDVLHLDLDRKVGGTA